MIRGASVADDRILRGPQRGEMLRRAGEKSEGFSIMRTGSTSVQGPPWMRTGSEESWEDAISLRPARVAAGQASLIQGGPAVIVPGGRAGADGRDRTDDQRFTIPLLYH